jgi:NADPH:quinone reductase-like Zn-dependent oxidoreductase
MRMHAYGRPDVIHADHLDVPEPGPGEVLLRVAGTSFNPSDLGLRRGMLRGVFRFDLPYAMGLDVAGTVTATGRDVPALTVGDEVVGRLDGGAAAEFALAPANVLARAPRSIPLADAAVLPIAGVTAWQAVFEHARVSPGDRVLVNGVGAIGWYVIQLARHAGAHVIALAGERRTAAAHDAGAHEVNPGLLEPVDAVIHLVPAAPPRVDGRLVSATTPGEGHFIVRNRVDDLAGLIALIDAGAVRVEVAARRPITDLAAVHREAEAGTLAGKTVLTP